MGLAAAFWVMAVFAVAAALLVVSLRNIFRTALALIVCFIAVAGLYITLSADFLAAAQILVYVGAISVLIILAIMMTREVRQGNPANRPLKLPVLAVAVVLLGLLVYVVVASPWQVSGTPPLAPTTGPLSRLLFGSQGYVLATEICAVLILAAILGAIVLAKEKEE
ncbi:MAG: NADH-quinone oxidoreductase subunit J [Dehalococcoidales bacterium]|nr:NADH-quinone oxidoreductase subunit J [Dehalococcoidales bacterium]